MDYFILVQIWTTLCSGEKDLNLLPPHDSSAVD